MTNAVNVAALGSGPAFSAYQSSPQTIPNGIFTKLLFQTEEFDTNNNFANSTFTPTVAGYYQVNCSLSVNGGSTGEILISITKNGNEYKRGVDTKGSTDVYNIIGAALVYCNGLTDYIDIYCYQSTGSNKTLNAQSAYTWFQASMVRGG